MAMSLVEKFFFLGLVFWQELSDSFVSQNLSFIFSDWFWFVHIPFVSVSMVKFHFLKKFPWIPFPTQSSLDFIAGFLHLLIIWLIVSSPSPHNLHLLFCRVLFIFTNIIGLNGVVLCYYLKTFSFSLQVSFS